MPKYRKKPVEVEAVQHTKMESDGTSVFPVFATDPTDWLTDAMELPDGSVCGVTWDDRALSIMTLEGKMRVSPGDYIIRGVNGELYPCKPDVFAKTYDEVL